MAQGLIISNITFTVKTALLVISIRETTKLMNWF